MDVAVLQQHLSDLAGLLRQAKASEAVVGGVAACAAALAPFAGYKIEQFAAFLKVADDYRRAGITPDKVPSRATPAKGRAPKAAVVPAPEAIDRVDKLYKDILNPNLTAEHIDQELSLLDGLKKAELLTAAERVGIKALVKQLNVDPMREAIKKAIRDRRGMFNRPTY